MAYYGPASLHKMASQQMLLNYSFICTEKPQFTEHLHLLCFIIMMKRKRWACTNSVKGNYSYRLEY